MPVWHGTTIMSVRKNGKVVVAGDGQVSMGQTVMKPNARKVRRLHDGSVIGGFAGATADAFTLFERLEAKLERHNGQLMRAAVEPVNRQGIILAPARAPHIAVTLFGSGAVSCATKHVFRGTLSALTRFSLSQAQRAEGIFGKQGSREN